MELQLINGYYKAQDVIDLVTQLVQVKIRRHEHNIWPGASEEDVTMAESRIRQLQSQLAEFRLQVQQEEGDILLEAFITASVPALAH